MDPKQEPKNKMRSPYIKFFWIGTVSAVFFPILLVVRAESGLVNFGTHDGHHHNDEDNGPWMMRKWKHSTLNPNLPMDTALLTVVSKLSTKVEIFAQSIVCHECPLMRIADIGAGENQSFTADTRFPLSIYISKSGEEAPKKYCQKQGHFGEYGIYSLWIDSGKIESTEKNKSDVCTFSTNKEPINSLIPIYVALGILAALSVIWIIVLYCYRRKWLYHVLPCMETERLINSDLGPPSPAQSTNDSEQDILLEKPLVKKERLKSLDTFRGISLVIMIFVNYHGGHYWFFHHSAWNGLTVADLVFPWFTFIMGTSMAYAFKAMLRRSIPRKQIALKVIRRTAILFFLGLVISNSGCNEEARWILHIFTTCSLQDVAAVDVTSMRIPGVLQRLALSYFAVAILQVFFSSPNDVYQHRWWSPVRDILPFWPEWLVMFAILAVNLGLTFGLSFEDCPRGYLGPGGLHQNSTYENCTGGAAGYIDRAVFGESHIYQHPTCKKIFYSKVPFDPEGILGTLTSMFICFLGLQAGKIFLTYNCWIARTKRFIIWTILLGVVAGGLCGFTQNDGVIPVNKNLWSVSFILALASMANLLLLVCYLLVDVFNIWSGAPFFFPGMNSIVVYMCHEVFENYFPVQFKVPQTHAWQFSMSLYGACLWTVMTAVLYYKKIFISI